MSLTQIDGEVKFDTVCAADFRARRDDERLYLKVALSFGKGRNGEEFVEARVSVLDSSGSSENAKSSDRRSGSDSHGSDCDTNLCFFSKGVRDEVEPGVGGSLKPVVMLRSSSFSSDGTDPGRDKVEDSERSLIPSLVAVFSLPTLKRASRRGLLDCSASAVRPAPQTLPWTVFLVLSARARFRGKGIVVASSKAATDGGISA